MIKNKYVQVVSRAFILAIMIAGATLSLGAIYSTPNWYVYYTNLSNYFCLLVVFFEIIFTIANLCKSKNSKEIDVHPALKFACLIAITVTFLVTNLVLKNPLKAEYWSDAENVLMHMVNPLLFWIDWILFSTHKNTRWFYPLLEVIFPLAYVAYILIRGAIISGTAPEWVKVYPYFFLNVTELGYGGVALWVLGLVAVFLLLGYIIFVLDNIPNFVKKHKEKKLKQQQLNEKNKD